MNSAQVSDDAVADSPRDTLRSAERLPNQQRIFSVFVHLLRSGSDSLNEHPTHLAGAAVSIQSNVLGPTCSVSSRTPRRTEHVRRWKGQLL